MPSARTDDASGIRVHPGPIVILLLLMISQHIPAQIRGSVRDPEGEALIGANVLIQGTVLGAATGTDGRFTIGSVDEGTHVLLVSMIGYQRRMRSVTLGKGDSLEVDIVLAESAIETSEIVITAGRRAQSFDEIPVSIATFDNRDVEERTLLKLDDALRYIPGVNMTESQVNIRGSSGYSRGVGTRVLLLLDGMPVLAGDAGEIKFDIVPMYMIDRIEVVKGAGSALYGSSALGGVINVLTANPVGPVLRARLYAGMYDNPGYDEWKWWGDSPRLFNGVDLQHGNRIGAASYLLSGGLRHDQGYRLNDDFVKWNLNAKAAYRFDPGRNLDVSVNTASDYRGNWIFWRGLDHALVPPLSADVTERISSLKVQAGARYRETVRKDLSYMLRVHAYLTDYDTESDTSDFSFRPKDKAQSRAWSLGSEAQVTWAAFERGMLIAGVELQYNTVDALIYGTHNGFSVAGYAQTEYQPVDEITVTAGGRFDVTAIDTVDSDSQFNPRVGVAWTPVKGSIVRASYGRGFRAPSIGERFASVSGSGLKTKPNPGLLSEHSTSYELGVKQELPVPALLDVAVFRSDYTNLVEPTIDASDGRIIFQNITRARIEGIEVSILASFFGRALESSVGYTYMYPRDLNLEKILKYRPRHLLYISGRVNLFDITAGMDFRYLSRVEEIDDALGIVIPDAERRVETFVTDFRIGWETDGLGVPLKLGFLVDNIFQYNYTELVGNLAPIRNYTLTLETRI